MKKILKLMISLTLVMAIGLSPAVSHLPNTVKNEVRTFADELPDTTPGPEENTEDIEYTKACEEEAYIVEEDEDLREVNKKYFSMSDGSIKACIYPQAVHYESNGEYLEIDNSLELIEVQSEEFIQLEENAEALENELIDDEAIVEDITGTEDYIDTDNEEAIATDIESTIDIESEAVTEIEAATDIDSENNIDIESEAITADKYINRTKPSRKGAYYKNKENRFTVKLPEVYGEDYTEFTDENGFVSFKLLDTKKINLKKEDIKAINENDEKIARNVTDKGSYKSIKKNIDLEYDVSGSMLKETIVLNEKTKEDFKFEIKTSAKEVKLNDDKSVSFYDENANELYRISAPYMTDAIGEYSTAIDVDLKENQNGYLLKLKPNKEWLYDEKREYPIKIDPTMFKALDVENITDTLLTEDDGTEHRTYMYDDNGNIFGVKIIRGSETTYYYYQLNIQGDVIGIFDSDGLLVASYTYDDWGKVLSIEGSDAEGIGKKNPIRYRGYYYDEET